MHTHPAHLHVAGVDEAGRGPMVGPLVVCGIMMSSNQIAYLVEIGVQDSKVISAKRREFLFAEIMALAEGIAIRRITAVEIDEGRARGVSLNRIEVSAFASVARELHPDVVYMDAADVVPRRFEETVAHESGLANCQFVAEHKADSKYPIVAAASIVAKVERDREIQRLHTIYGDFGSGYPSDPKTVRFVEHIVRTGEPLPPVVRKSWNSVKRVIEASETKQSRLEG
ncbi:MAG: ribonuclease HII [Candidatus Thorarchaeota archaeon]|nr:MAG: ribonuclease HII [Candidatus Thorarchaeota archaeon]